MTEKRMTEGNRRRIENSRAGQPGLILWFAAAEGRLAVIIY